MGHAGIWNGRSVLNCAWYTNRDVDHNTRARRRDDESGAKGIVCTFILVFTSGIFYAAIWNAIAHASHSAVGKQR